MIYIKSRNYIVTIDTDSNRVLTIKNIDTNEYKDGIYDPDIDYCFIKGCKANKLPKQVFKSYDHAYNHNRKTMNGINKTFHQNGIVKEEVALLNGLKNGTYKRYCQNGKLIESGQYHRDIPYGTWTDGSYVNGKKYGKWVTIHGTGKFFNGKKVGIWTESDGTKILYCDDSVYHTEIPSKHWIEYSIPTDHHYWITDTDFIACRINRENQYQYSYLMWDIDYRHDELIDIHVSSSPGYLKIKEELCALRQDLAILIFETYPKLEIAKVLREELANPGIIQEIGNWGTPNSNATVALRRITSLIGKNNLSVNQIREFARYCLIQYPAFACLFPASNLVSLTLEG